MSPKFNHLPDRKARQTGILGWICLAGLLTGLLSSCSFNQKPAAQISISLTVDGITQSLKVNQGITVSQALAQAGVTLGSLDRSDPPVYTLATDGLNVKVVRIVEEFIVNQVVIGYAQQTISNESLATGEQRLIQPGQNGLEEITTRIVYEDGIETTRSQVKTVILQEAVPEIVMVGVQEPFAAVTLPGRLVYLTAGNAWVMDGSSGLRTPLVTTGDLDGRIFRLSEGGDWLLFTRKAESVDGSQINSLWVARVGSSPNTLVDLQISNVIHFADFIPGFPQSVAYSTVEPRQAAPGWQANNDLLSLHYSAAGILSDQREYLGVSSGGIYGWWGTDYLWSEDGSKLIYSRPDSVGAVDFETGTVEPFVDLVPYQTNSSWALIPPVSLDAGGQVLYYVSHPDTAGVASAEDSPAFDLSAVNLTQGQPVALARQSGMFAYPALSPFDENNGCMLAYLQAVFPDRSDTSTYRLIISDQDGSNRRVIFPKAGSSGMDPQKVVWSPEPGQAGSYLLAFVYQGNIWLADSASGSSQQITGDGLTSRIDWR